MAAAHSFQVQLGINDTPLTRALELGCYTTAEILIEENALDPSYLNEGPYERVPLYIVLCGQNQDGSPRARNLHIARLLVQHGADTNKRIPMYELGLMVYAIGSSRSPMELLILFFIHCLQLHLENQVKEFPAVVGFNKQTHLSFQDLQTELLELVDLFIARESEVNLWYDNHYPMINYLLQTCPDADLMQKLCEAGADLNAIDAHGNTAILALCQPLYSEPEDRKWLRLNNQKEVLHYLLTWKDVEINAVNCQGQSALWLCFSAHWWDMAKMLIKSGANLSLSAMVYIPAFPEERQPDLSVAERIPGFFSAAVGTSLLPKFENVINTKSYGLLSYMNAFKNLSNLAAIIDSGLLTDKSEMVEESLMSFLSWNKSFSMHNTLLKSLHKKDFIIPNLFGQLSVSLKQHCVRTILYNFITNMYPIKDNSQSTVNIVNVEEIDEIGNDKTESTQVKYYKNTSFCKDYKSDNGNIEPCFKWLFHVSIGDLQRFLQKLGLPNSFTQAFEFELYRYKLMILLRNSEKDWVPCECSDLDMFVETTDSDVSDGDSEMEDEDYPYPILFRHGEIDCIVTHF